MGFWNYRAIRHDHVPLEEDEEDYLIGIHEVYYNEDGTINGWTESIMAPLGESEEEIISILDKMRRAVEDKELLSMKELLSSIEK